MRTLRVSIVVFGLLASRVAAAQTEPKADDAKPAAAEPGVKMDNQVSGDAAPPPAAAPVSSPPPVENTPAPAPSVPEQVAPNDWKFDFHGYIRAPLRFGVGHRDAPAKGQGATTIHQPIVPDDQYLSWQYTGVQSKDWAELFLSYGTTWVKATVGLLGFQFSDAAWVDPTSQFGVGQGWLTLTPSLGYQNVRLEVKAGNFWSKYGMAGKYDAGKYDTFLFGRTHTMGETGRMELDLGNTTLWVEEGFGGKSPDPSIYNGTKFTLLAHAHAGLHWNKKIDFSAHFLHSWAAEEDRAGVGAAFKNLPDGQITVSGADVRFNNIFGGDLYAGFSHIGAKNAQVVDAAIEVLHSNGGGEYTLGVKSNYLDGKEGTDGTPLKPTGQSNGNGSVNTLLLQYDFSLASLLAGLRNPPADYWGDGPNLAASFFMMYNMVSSESPDADGVKKFKWGVDVLGTPVKWAGIGVRFDRVQPNSKIPEESFAVISPRLVFKTAFVTHEELTLQFSRYLYNQRECAKGTDPTLCVQPPAAPVLPTGFGAPSNAPLRGAPVALPDLNVLKLQATMWW